MYEKKNMFKHILLPKSKYKTITIINYYLLDFFWQELSFSENPINSNMIPSLIGDICDKIS